MFKSIASIDQHASQIQTGPINIHTSGQLLNNYIRYNVTCVDMRFTPKGRIKGENSPQSSTVYVWMRIWKPYQIMVSRKKGGGGKANLDDLQISLGFGF
jgi:hypothetical protein